MASTKNVERMPSGRLKYRGETKDMQAGWPKKKKSKK